jgi:Protein of unknown function (DUF2911)
MSKSILISASVLACAALSFAWSPKSPPAQTSVTIGGKTITIKYFAPSLRGRKMFGPDGQISKDPTYPAWRTGADDATALHTDADLVIGGLNVPKGDYTIYTAVDTTPWTLIVNKQTKQWGTEYDKTQDVGRVPMTVTKPAAPIELMKITLTGTGGNKGKLQVEWENVIASVPLTVK